MIAAYPSSVIVKAAGDTVLWVVSRSQVSDSVEAFSQVGIMRLRLRLHTSSPSSAWKARRRLETWRGRKTSRRRGRSSGTWGNREAWWRRRETTSCKARRGSGRACGRSESTMGRVSRMSRMKVRWIGVAAGLSLRWSSRKAIGGWWKRSRSSAQACHARRRTMSCVVWGWSAHWGVETRWRTLRGHTHWHTSRSARTTSGGVVEACRSAERLMLWRRLLLLLLLWRRL